MARTEKYFVGPRLLGEIRDTISRVSGTPSRTSGQSFRTCFQDLRQPPASSTSLKLGIAAAAWPKDSLGNVRVYDQGAALLESAASPPEVLQDCVNKLIDVDIGDIVIVGRINGRWYLINAGCG